MTFGPLDPGHFWLFGRSVHLGIGAFGRFGSWAFGTMGNLELDGEVDPSDRIRTVGQLGT